MATGAGGIGQKLLGAIRAHAGIAVAVGVVLILLGVLAICAPFVAGLSVMLMLGGLLLAGGVALCVLASRAGAFTTGLPVLLMGVLMVFAGFYMLSRPVSALASMTLLLAAYLVVSGIIELVAGFRARPEDGWGWVVASAVVSLVLGVMLWRQWPVSGMWAIGTLFGIKLMMTGLSMTSIGMTVRRGVRGVEAMLKS